MLFLSNGDTLIFSSQRTAFSLRGLVVVRPREQEGCGYDSEGKCDHKDRETPTCPSMNSWSSGLAEQSKEDVNFYFNRDLTPFWLYTDR